MVKANHANNPSETQSKKNQPEGGPVTPTHGNPASLTHDDETEITIGDNLNVRKPWRSLAHLHCEIAYFKLEPWCWKSTRMRSARNQLCLHRIREEKGKHGNQRKVFWRKCETFQVYFQNKQVYKFCWYDLSKSIIFEPFLPWSFGDTDPK